MNFPSNLRDELKHSVGEQRPDGQADEVGQHFGEIGFFGEGDQQEAEQRRQVDDGDGQKPVTPHCQGGEGEWLLSCSSLIRIKVTHSLTQLCSLW